MRKSFVVKPNDHCIIARCFVPKFLHGKLQIPSQHFLHFTHFMQDEEIYLTFSGLFYCCCFFSLTSFCNLIVWPPFSLLPCCLESFAATFAHRNAFFYFFFVATEISGFRDLFFLLFFICKEEKEENLLRAWKQFFFRVCTQEYSQFTQRARGAEKLGHRQKLRFRRDSPEIQQVFHHHHRLKADVCGNVMVGSHMICA